MRATIWCAILRDSGKSEIRRNADGAGGRTWGMPSAAQRTAEASLAEQPEQSAESKAEILLSELAEVG